MYKGDWDNGRYADYIGSCHALDQNVGRLVDTLRQKGIYDDTVIIYCSDHGDHFQTMNGEHKRQCFDSCLRIPLIIKGTDDFRGGITKTEPVSLINLPPTILEMAGVSAPDTFQEPPLHQLMRGDGWDNCVFYQISEAELARGIRTERWKYCVYAPHVQEVLDMGARFDTNHYRNTLRKAVPYSDDYVDQYLFDTYNDPYELHNLIDDPDYYEIRETLRANLGVRMLGRLLHDDRVIAGVPGPDLLDAPGLQELASGLLRHSDGQETCGVGGDGEVLTCLDVVQDGPSGCDLSRKADGGGELPAVLVDVKTSGSETLVPDGDPFVFRTILFKNLTKVSFNAIISPKIDGNTGE